ncbi:MAG TPA: MipA/OmpV family protein [Cellvibrio sp.]|nr:MipA/OmpV family protein [Cellvibrio sp.]
MWSKRVRIGLWLGCLLVSVTLPARAGDLASDVRKGASGPDNRNGGYIEIGLGVESFTNPIVGWPEGNEKGEVHTGLFVDVSARYQYQCLFAEIFSQSLEQFTLGCNVYNGKNWSVDWVGLAQHDEISVEKSDDYRGLKKRRFDFLSGPRATAYFGNYIVQLHALMDVSNTHHGELYSLKLARHWQYRNWTIHGIVGATYRSQQITDYYFSIDESEASERYPQYEAPSMMAYIAELGATYPISEKWVFRGFYRRVQLDSASPKSPLILDDHGDIIATSINYVF